MDKLIERIKADREAGTDGPWLVHDGMNSRPIEVAACYLAHFSGGQGAAKHQTANTRRIARVPDMEARILADAAIIKAAAELAEQAEYLWSAVTCGDYDPPQVSLSRAVVDDVLSASGAYRAAVAEGRGC